MKHIKDLTFRGHEIVLYQDEVTQLYTVDIRKDAYDGDIIAGYADFATINDARYCAMAFIDGLKQGERR